jgi:biotin carboxyl carrier protein
MSQTVDEKKTTDQKEPGIRARLDGETYDISIHEEDGIYRVQLGEESFTVQRQLLDGRGLTSLLIDNRPFQVEVESVSAGFSVTLAGAAHTVEILDPLAALARRAARKRAGPEVETIAAPMPGLVVSIEIRVGDRVEAGTPLVVVEAMKMQNELSAAHPGVVRQVKVEPGQKVNTGEALIVLEQV